ncbi:MAG: hypothetical protein FD153_3 [Rhodospirillaceae bacterium]|nr:MAG: hypothetical protein FD153_3 [Rhodospirillaceae bacterium]
MTNTQMVLVGLFTLIGATLGATLFLPTWTSILMVGIGAAGFVLGVVAMVNGITGLTHRG